MSNLACSNLIFVNFESMNNSSWGPINLPYNDVKSDIFRKYRVFSLQMKIMLWFVTLFFNGRL